MKRIGRAVVLTVVMIVSLLICAIYGICSAAAHLGERRMIQGKNERRTA